MSIHTVDVGLPQLAMHSCYETSGVKDALYLEKAMGELFAMSLIPGQWGVTIE